MALFRTGDATQISGSIGGRTYSRNRFGSYFRGRSVPVNPNTDPQKAARAALIDANQRWRALSTATRTFWATYAANTPWVNRLGETVYLTGHQQFIRYYTFVVAAGYNSTQAASFDQPEIYGSASSPIFPPDDTVATVVPETMALQNDISSGTGALPNTLTLDWGAVGNVQISDGQGWTLLIGLLQPGTINFYGGPWTTIDRYTGLGGDLPADGTPTVYDLNALFGWVVQPGSKLWLRMRRKANDGRISLFGSKITFSRTYTIP